MRLPTILATLLCLAAPAFAEDKSILLIAGPPSHGPGEHEHNAGVQLLAKCLKDVPNLKVDFQLNGWPKDPAMLENRAAIIIQSDGGGGHPALKDDHLAQLQKQISKGTGFGTIHYAVEPTIPLGEKEFLDWMGGCFEINWSVNPHWEADFTKFPDHPVTRGVKPFKINDEWYFHMRFRDNAKGVTPILSAIAPDSTMTRPDGTHSGNLAVRKEVADKVPQTMMWVCENENGQRGFGFTGAHYHKNWGDENFRRVALNAILWISHIEVPASGVQSTVTPEELAANLDPLDPKGKKK